MTKWRRNSTLLMAAVLTAAALPCGTMPGEVQAAEAEKEWEYKEDTITMLIDTDTAMGGIQAVCDLAKEKLGITVEIETRVGGPDGRNIVKTRLASGDMADLCGFNSGCLLEELNPSEYFIDLSGEEWINKLDDTFKEAVTVDGGVYGVPTTSTSGGLVLYNKEIYEKCGLEVPETWKEFMENCQVLKDAGETALIGSFGTMWTAQVQGTLCCERGRTSGECMRCSKRYAEILL